ncbi:MAG: hypothetical protein ACFB2Y_23630 [Fulvivirga sp.]
MKSSIKTELQELLHHIEENYAGDYASISHDLNKAIYFLHYVERDMIDPIEVQDISHALHTLSECFYRAHSQQRLHALNQNLHE